ncbi:MAG: hypothetical protein RL226_304, partial [Bacteroidota bacterium]
DDVIVGNFGGALNLPASAISATMSLDIYDSNAPSTVVVSLQDASGAELALYTLNTSTSNQWETLLMDLNPLLGFPNVTDFVILIEPGQLVAETFYLDNFQYETTVGLEEQALQAFTCYPNPGENVRLSWASSAVAPEFVRIFDASGRLVQELSTKGLQQIEVVGLESGVYFAHAEGFGTYRFVISSNAR